MNFISVKTELQNLVSQVVEKLFVEKEVELSAPSDLSHGDLTTNISLQVAAEYKKNPREVAEEIINELELPDFVAKVEVAGPGFINFTFSDSYLIDLLTKKESILEVKTQSEKIIVEYSSPNIAKPLGIHHLLSTAIGQSLSNILEEVGNEIQRTNYIGDWGTQFGKLMYAYKEWGDEETVKSDPIPELLQLYVEFHNKAEEDDTLEDKGRAEFRKLEEGDEENRKLWEWIVEISKQEIKKIYELLGGIHFDNYNGESYLEDRLEKILEEGKSEGVMVEGEKGAYIIDLEVEGMIPYLVQKADGATLYATRDIASIQQRIEDENPDEIIWVVDIAQQLHFQQLFASVRKLSWFNPETELTHIRFGRMSFKDGKMSTRKGNIIQLEDVLEEAIERSKTIIEEKNPELENKDEVAHMIGTGAVKYSILAQAPETDIVFDWAKILSFEGNSAPYLQYSHARAKSILRKADFSEIPELDTTHNLLPKEAEVIRKLALFVEAINYAAELRKPNIIATYLYELAQTYSSFYAKCSVLNAEDETSKQIRLAIVHTFAEVMNKGLNLLAGIEAPEEM
jgi:arginyl-tRNA synthetase